MGLGYYLYAAGSMSYDSAFKEVSFTVEPIKLAKKNIKTKTKIVDIKYNLYVSNSQDDIVEASLCERYLPDSVMEFQKVHEEMYRNSFTFGVRVILILFRKEKLWANTKIQPTYTLL